MPKCSGAAFPHFLIEGQNLLFTAKNLATVPKTGRSWGSTRELTTSPSASVKVWTLGELPNHYL